MKTKCGLRKLRYSQSGFTIVELLVAMLIGAILTTAIVGVFIQQTKAMALNEGLVDLQQNLRVAMDMLHRDVRQAGLYLDRQNMPSFILGDIYYKDKTNNMVMLDSEGGAGTPLPSDAIQVRYSPKPAVGIGAFSGVNFQVCYPSGLYDDQTIEISYPANDGSYVYPINGLIKITSLNLNTTCTGSAATFCSGSCDRGNFSPGQSEWNPPGGLIDYDLSGNLWSELETLTYFVDQNYTETSRSFGPALMQARGLEPPSVVAFGINNLQIVYRDVAGAPTTTLDNIRRVEIVLSGETRNEHSMGGVRNKKTRTMTTEVLVRNLAY